MARFVDVIDVPVPIEEAFDYLADFSNTAEWDPGVVEAERLSSGPIEKGSRFRVVVSFLGRSMPFEYRITALERPSRIVLCAGDSGLRSLDEITLAPRAGGTRVTYEAQLQLGGLRRLADPILDALFQIIGGQAARGLRRRLSSPSRTSAAARERASKPHARRTTNAKPVRRTNGVPQKEGVAR